MLLSGLKGVISLRTTHVDHVQLLLFFSFHTPITVLKHGSCTVLNFRLVICLHDTCADFSARFPRSFQ